MVLTDRVADVAVHDLHVVNVVEQLEPLGADALYQFRAPRHMVALVILVIALAVQQFHAQRHLQFFRQRQNAFQADGAILQALRIVEAGAVAGETNQPLVTRVRRFLEPLLVGWRQFVVMLDAVPRLANAAETVNHRIGNHRADEAIFLDRLKFGLIEQVNRDEAHFLAGGAKIVQFDFAVAPAARAVVDVALELGGRR